MSDPRAICSSVYCFLPIENAPFLAMSKVNPHPGWIKKRGEGQRSQGNMKRAMNMTMSGSGGIIADFQRERCGIMNSKSLRRLSAVAVFSLVASAAQATPIVGAQVFGYDLVKVGDPGNAAHNCYVAVSAEFWRSFLSTLKAGFFSSAQTGPETALLAGRSHRGMECRQKLWMWMSITGSSSGDA